jgi:hypothetical protein
MRWSRFGWRGVGASRLRTLLLSLDNLCWTIPGILVLRSLSIAKSPILI